MGCGCEPRPPHRIRGLARAERPAGVNLRTATEADGAALREIELQTPIVLGETQVVYDRGKDYFAAERLMGNVITHIVEMGGRPVGLTSWVLNEIRLNGTKKTGSYKHRTRLLPEARGRGIRQRLDFEGFEAHAWRRDVFYTYAAAGNETIHRIYAASDWNVHPQRIVIDTSRQSEPDAGRSSTVADSGRIVDLLNRTHGREELYVPYTADSLAARLEREPGLYSWPHLRLGERAVLGVWPAHLGVIRTSAGESTTDDRALVLDYGHEEGAEDELIALLQAECSILAESGTTELALFVSPPVGGVSFAVGASEARRTLRPIPLSSAARRPC